MIGHSCIRLPVNLPELRPSGQIKHLNRIFCSEPFQTSFNIPSGNRQKLPSISRYGDGKYPFCVGFCQEGTVFFWQTAGFLEM